MSMHDVDKRNGNRGLSSLNAADGQRQRMAHNTMSTSYKQEGADNFRIVFKNSIILYIDSDDKITGVDGFIPELGSTPVKIFAKPGLDVYEDILGIDPPAV